MAYYGGLSNLQSPETSDISFKIRGTAVNKVIVKLALHEKCFLQLFASALRSLRISVISALTIVARNI